MPLRSAAELQEVQVQLVEKAAREEVDSLTLRDEALRRDQ